MTSNTVITATNDAATPGDGGVIRLHNIPIKGCHYHIGTKTFHLRLDNYGTLGCILTLLQLQQQQQQESNPLHHWKECISVNISIGEGFLEPLPATRVPFIINDIDENTAVHKFVTLCRVISETFLELKHVQMSRALAGFAVTNATSWCPVQATEVVLNNNQLQSLTLRNLSFYDFLASSSSSSSLSLWEENNHNNVLKIMTTSLQGHASLQRFVWQQCDVMTMMRRNGEQRHNSNVTTTLDPLLQGLSNIPKLSELVIQTPSWWSPPFGTMTGRTTTLMLPSSLQGLHLDGLQLENDHLGHLLQGKERLQQLSLSLHLSLHNIQNLATILARFLSQPNCPLRQLSLRLDWLLPDHDSSHQGGLVDADADADAATKHTMRHQRLLALQSFQDTLGLALLPEYQHYYYHYHYCRSDSNMNLYRPASRLQQLELIYYDDSDYVNKCQQQFVTSAATASSCSSHRFIIDPQIFVRILETNPILQHLRLPYCGEMHPRIGFLLKMNRTGLRTKLLITTTSPTEAEAAALAATATATAATAALSGDEDDNDSTSITIKTASSGRSRKEDGIAALRKIQERPEECWAPASCMQTLSLSMMYYLLQEMPEMFQ